MYFATYTSINTLVKLTSKFDGRDVYKYEFFRCWCDMVFIVNSEKARTPTILVPEVV